MLIHALLLACLKSGCRQKHKVRQNKSQGKNESRGVHAFCLTRWAVRGEALAVVINNHAEPIEPWDWSLTVSKDKEMKARIRPHWTLNFYLSCTLGEQPLRQTDNLGWALHDSSTSAAQGNTLSQDVAKPYWMIGLIPHLFFFGLRSYRAKLQIFTPSYTVREKHPPFSWNP